ncbi:MAG: Uma2 family endonuclease [Peptococcaceae bacterium]|jgi:Uma2 family endonuclease|nr:Uma2 family endonuclease [Peptococcaceae bacterium]
MEDFIFRSDKHYTYGDYCKLRDEHNYEVIGGTLIIEPKPGPRHQEIVRSIAQVLGDFLRKHDIGKVYIDVDVVFEDQVVSPDLVFIAKDRLAIVRESHIQGAPDLVIEVFSPGSEFTDRKHKGDLYFANGVTQYWMVDPDTFLVEVLSLAEGGWLVGVYDEKDTFSSPVFPELRIEVKDFFGLS